jgi:hypothetical protein
MNSESIKKVTNQAIEQLIEALKAGKSEALTNYLAAVAKFHRYSFQNILLIAGHANKSVTDGYSKLKEDVPFRKKVVEQVGTGFRLPVTKPEVAPNCTQSELLSIFA